MSETPIYHGQCFCGEVVLEVNGEPKIAGYCHCNDCREWSACPVTAWMMWPYEALKVVQGEKSLLTYAKTERTRRAWCAKCGGHLGAIRADAEWPHFVGLPANFPDLEFKPELHVWCRDAVVVIEDELPKYDGTIPR
jgi:hypothetical protein